MDQCITSSSCKQKGDIILFMKKLVSALNDGDIFYYSFKYGYFSENKKWKILY